MSSRRVRVGVAASLGTGLISLEEPLWHGYRFDQSMQGHQQLSELALAMLGDRLALDVVRIEGRTSETDQKSLVLHPSDNLSSVELRGVRYIKLSLLSHDAPPSTMKELLENRPHTSSECVANDYLSELAQRELRLNPENIDVIMQRMRVVHQGATELLLREAENTRQSAVQAAEAAVMEKSEKRARKLAQDLASAEKVARRQRSTLGEKTNSPGEVSKLTERLTKLTGRAEKLTSALQPNSPAAAPEAAAAVVPEAAAAEPSYGQLQLQLQLVEKQLEWKQREKKKEEQQRVSVEEQAVRSRVALSKELASKQAQINSLCSVLEQQSSARAVAEHEAAAAKHQITSMQKQKADYEDRLVAAQLSRELSMKPVELKAGSQPSESVPTEYLPTEVTSVRPEAVEPLSPSGSISGSVSMRRSLPPSPSSLSSWSGSPSQSSPVRYRAPNGWDTDRSYPQALGYIRSDTEISAIVNEQAAPPPPAGSTNSPPAALVELQTDSGFKGMCVICSLPLSESLPWHKSTTGYSHYNCTFNVSNSDISVSPTTEGIIDRHRQNESPSFHRREQSTAAAASTSQKMSDATAGGRVAQPLECEESCSSRAGAVDGISAHVAAALQSGDVDEIARVLQLEAERRQQLQDFDAKLRAETSPSFGSGAQWRASVASCHRNVHRHASVYQNKAGENKAGYGPQVFTEALPSSSAHGDSTPHQTVSPMPKLDCRTTPSSPMTPELEQLNSPMTPELEQLMSDKATARERPALGDTNASSTLHSSGKPNAMSASGRSQDGGLVGETETKEQAMAAMAAQVERECDAAQWLLKEKLLKEKLCCERPALGDLNASPKPKVCELHSLLIDWLYLLDLRADGRCDSG